MSAAKKLAPAVLADAQRILATAARRILAEQLAKKASES